MTRLSRAARLVTAAAVAALAALSAQRVGLTSARADTLAWPDVASRVERDIASADVAARVSAIRRVDALGVARAAPLVLRALADADTDVRVAAAEAAVRLRVAGAADLVLPWLAERESRVRLAACNVARAVPDARAVTPLTRALGDADPNVRLAAVEALGAQSEGSITPAVSALLGKLDDPRAPVRIGIAQALAHLGDRRAVLPLGGKVTDPVLEVRQAVAHALGELGDPRAAPELTLLLRDGSVDVRVATLAALGRVGAIESVDAIGPLAAERTPAVRRAALTTLGILARGGSDAAMRLLADRLGVDDDAVSEPVATPVRDALRSAGPAVIGALRAIVRTGGAAAASSAAWVLGAAGDRDSAGDVVAALRRGRLPVVNALQALAGVGSPGDLPVALEYVSDDNPVVRRWAFDALSALLDDASPDGRSVEPLAAVLRAGRLSNAEQLRVLELLGRTRATRAAPLLQGFLGTHDPATRLAAVDSLHALGPAGPADTDAALLKVLAEPGAELRAHAAAALADVGGVAAREALLERLRVGDETDRAMALIALAGVLERAPSRAGVEELHRALPLSAGGERDAVLAVLGRAAPVREVLEPLVRDGSPEDRRAVLAASAGRAEAVSMLRAALDDPDPGVAAEAAWGLGAHGGVDLLAPLDRAAHDRAPALADRAVDATAAIGRIGARTHDAGATGLLCQLARDDRPLVREDAKAGLAIAGARCDSPASAARAAEPNTGKAWPRGPSVRMLVYIARSVRAEPAPSTPFLLELADGLVRAGTSDRRGAVFEPLAPPGPVRLRGR